MAGPPAHGEDMPLLASPAPHVGTGPTGSPDQSLQGAWKRLLVNSPPAWAASPDLKLPPSASAQRIPPFPWPAAPNIQIFGPGRSLENETATKLPTQTKPSCSEYEEEIARFLSHCDPKDSLDSLGSLDSGELGLGDLGDLGLLGSDQPLRTPSPRKRGSASYTWTPGICGTSPTLGSGTTAGSQRFRSDRGETPGETPDAATPALTSPGPTPCEPKRRPPPEPEAQLTCQSQESTR